MPTNPNPFGNDSPIDKVTPAEAAARQNTVIPAPTGGGSRSVTRNAWKLCAVFTAASDEPTKINAKGVVNAEGADDAVFMAIVKTAGGTKIAGRTYTLQYGRLGPVEGPARQVIGYEPATEDKFTTTATRPDLVVMVPTFRDHVFVGCDDIGTVDTDAAGDDAEAVYVYYKLVNRVS